MSLRILLLNGPNLNLLGTREPHIYGTTTLVQAEECARARAAAFGATLEAFQSNHEGVLVDAIHAAQGHVDVIVINPGALTHTSVALRDALSGVAIPFVEVHLSNIHAREPWRRKSFLSEKAVAVIAGMGVVGYETAIEFVAREMKSTKKARL